MNTISSKNGENHEGKPQVKINRKMRMWNKYKNYCFIGGGVLSVVLVIVLCVWLLPDKDDNNVVNNPTEAVTKDYVAQLGTQGATNESTEAQSQTSNETQVPTEAPTQTPTQAPTEAPTQAVSTAPGKVTFTAKDKFNDAVFVGDTVVNGISYYRYLEAGKVVSNINMVSEQAVNHVNTVMASNPKKVFIMVGLNDANYGSRTVDFITGGIEKFVKAVKAKNSSTEVYVLSVLPVTKDFESRSKVKQSFLNELNYALSTKASSMGAKYIDVATNFKDSNGYMFTQCSGTGSNLKQEYYPFLLNKIGDLM